MSYCLHYAKKYDVQWSDNAFFNGGYVGFEAMIMDNCEQYWTSMPEDGEIEGVDKEEFIALRDKIVSGEVNVELYFKDTTKEDVLECMNEIIENGEKNIDYFRFHWI